MLIDKDELYPYYYVSGTYGVEVELTDAEVNRIAACEVEFVAVQRMLAMRVAAAE